MLVAEHAPTGTRLVVLSVYHTTNAPPEIFSSSPSIVYMESRILTKHYLCGNGLHEVVQRAVHSRAVDLSVALQKQALQETFDVALPIQDEGPS